MSETEEAPAQSRDALLEESTAVVEDTHNMHVLTRAAVIAGIGALKAQRIHEHFPAYLQLRKLAIASDSPTSINPDWKEVSDLLKMPGGPPTKPHYRPFSSVNRRDETGYWYNRNLAGSYAPKSMRATSSFMLNANGDDYALPTDHAQQALDRLLKGTKVPAWALAAYYLRNYGFVFEGEGGYDELITAFRKEFHFEQDTDFDVIFEDNEPIQFTEPWFELFDQTSGNESDHKEGALND
ncbi:hypothetical protein ACGFZL_04820 [Streptomyces sp. NPDC048182]|uniref:hypothetical protein n=1 Tax=Streptomyces sp. NPDC048182 TaxID=3365507 RepID=UPI00371D5564